MNKYELKEALDEFKDNAKWRGTPFNVIYDAAKAHLATLPEPPKRVPLEQQAAWAQWAADQVGIKGSKESDRGLAAMETILALEEFLKKWNADYEDGVAILDTVYRFAAKFS